MGYLLYLTYIKPFFIITILQYTFLKVMIKVNLRTLTCKLCVTFAGWLKGPSPIWDILIIIIGLISNCYYNTGSENGFNFFEFWITCIKTISVFSGFQICGQKTVNIFWSSGLWV